MEGSHQLAFGATDPLLCCSRYTKYEASDYFFLCFAFRGLPLSQFGTLLIGALLAPMNVVLRLKDRRFSGGRNFTVTRMILHVGVCPYSLFKYNKSRRLKSHESLLGPALKRRGYQAPVLPRVSGRSSRGSRPPPHFHGSQISKTMTSLKRKKPQSHPLPKKRTIEMPSKLNLLG